MNTQFRPGELVKIPGQYQVIGVKGRGLNKEVTCTEGERFPPTQKKKQVYKLVDATKHKKS